jgi:hypothetical protein
MELFRTQLEIYQFYETMTIKNAQLDINNHLSEIDKKMPQAEKIIEFINSLYDQELKYSGVTDRFYVVLKIKNVIENG